MQDPFSFGDAFGPAKVVHVREPASGLRGILGVDHTADGPAAAFAAIEEKIRTSTEAVLEAAERDQVAPRQAALALAEDRVRRAMVLRRWSIF